MSQRAVRHNGHPSPAASHAQRTQWEQVAAHVAASFRLAMRLATEARDEHELPFGADAVLHSSGRVDQATASASDRAAQTALCEGVRRIERARCARGKREPEHAIAEWKGLIAARWTLLEVEEVGGRRYLVACENRNAGPRVAALTQRERQIVAFASLGYSHKLVAYHLGVGESTCRVLFSRALRKLGLRSRQELTALMTRAPGPQPSASAQPASGVSRGGSR